MNTKTLLQRGVPVCAALTLLIGTAAHAQGRGPGGRGGFPGFDREAIMERMMERYQTALEASDEEWDVMKPMVTAILEKQRETMGNRFRGLAGAFGGGFGRGDRSERGERRGRGGDRTERGGRDERGDRGNRGNRGGGGDEAINALQELLDSEDASPAEIKRQLAAVRKSRDKAAAELKKAREDFRSVLTVRQEASMVVMGLLD